MKNTLPNYRLLFATPYEIVPTDDKTMLFELTISVRFDSSVLNLDVNKFKEMIAKFLDLDYSPPVTTQLQTSTIINYSHRTVMQTFPSFFDLLNDFGFENMKMRFIDMIFWNLDFETEQGLTKFFEQFRWELCQNQWHISDWQEIYT